MALYHIRICITTGASLVAQRERICLQCGRPGFNPWIRKIPGRGHGTPLQYSWVSLVAQMVKSPSAMWETQVQSLDQEAPLEEGMAPHSSILVWRIQSGRLQSMGSQRVRHN